MTAGVFAHGQTMHFDSLFSHCGRHVPRWPSSTRWWLGWWLGRWFRFRLWLWLRAEKPAEEKPAEEQGGGGQGRAAFM